MKPTKMRNLQVYRATHKVRSRQLGAPLSPDLRKKHERRSIRVVTGDTVRVTRGEYKDVEGRVTTVTPLTGRIAIDGVKKTKGKGEKFDVMIHSSNVVVMALKTSDTWRQKKLKHDDVEPISAEGPSDPAPDLDHTEGSTAGSAKPAAEAAK